MSISCIPFEKTVLKENKIISSIDQDFKDNDKPYILTNECNCENIIEFIRKIFLTDDSSRVHFGFSGWYNFDLIVAAKSEYAVLGDISEPTRSLYEQTKRVLAAVNTRFEFVDQIVDFFEKDQAGTFYRAKPSIQEQSFKIRAQLLDPISWLGSTSSFEKIKNMHKEGKIEFIRFNIQDGESLGKFSTWLKLNELKLATLYVSNIGDLLAPWGREEIERMHHSLLKIINVDTWVIDATNSSEEMNSEGTGYQEPQCILSGKIYHPELIRKNKIPFSKKNP